MKKRFLAIMLALCMLCSLLPVPTFAAVTASGTCGDNLTWILDAEGVLTISGTGEMYDYTSGNHSSVPSTAPWNSYRQSITSVIIEDDVTSIGDYSFYYCTELSEISIPDSVTTIGDISFGHCHSLNEFVFSDSITSIGFMAFVQCVGLLKVTIGKNVRTLGNYAFSECTNLKEIYFLGNAPQFDVDHFENIIATAYYPAGDATWTSDIMQNYGGEITWIESCFGNHIEIVDTAVTPSCTESGLTEGAHCAICDHVLVVQEILPALGHNGVNDNGYPATCTEAGLTNGSHCDRCGISLVDQEAVSALGHTGGKATCKEQAVCTRCRETYGEIDPTNHVGGTVTRNIKEETCTGTGYTGDTYCLDCNAQIAVGQEIPARGHSMGQWKVTKDCTCTEDGTIRRECVYCGYIETDTLEAWGHDLGEWETTQEPSCTTSGSKNRFCERSQCDYSETEEIAAVGHAWDNGVVTKEPTEEETGIRTFTCGTCGATRTETIPTLDHVHSYTAVVTDPTCTEAGFTTYTCRCGDTYVDDEVVALGHTEVTDAAVAPTCTETGLTEGKHCSVCGTVTVDQTEVAATGHTEVTDAAVAPICTESGLTEGKHCSVCEEVLTAQEEIPALGHSWNEGVVTKEPTEEDAGIRTFTCETCDETRTEEIPVLDHVHSYTAVVTDPTCTEVGFTTYTCGCGDSYTADETEAMGHTEVVDAAVAATCTVVGVQDCSRGGTYHNKYFRQTAETHGLVCTRTDKYGWSNTSAVLSDELLQWIIDNDIQEIKLSRNDPHGVRIAVGKTTASGGALPVQTISTSRSYRWECPCCHAIARSTRMINLMCGDCLVPLVG